MPRVAAEVRAKREGARRTQILEAAAHVFSRKGFDGATVSEIARAAKLSEGSIYNYFRSKEDLLIHIPQHLVQPVLVPLVEAVPVPRSSEEMERLLTVMSHAMVDRVRAHAPFLKVFLSALPYLSLSARRQYMQLLPTYAAEALERFLREGMRRGVVRRDLNPVIAARTLPGMLLMFLMTQEVLLGRQLISYGYDEIVPEAVRLFLYGAVPRDAAPRTSRRRTNVRVIVTVLALLALAVAAPMAAAQTPAPPPAPRTLGLAEAITLALQQNQQLRVSAFEVTIARAQLAQARGGRSPQLNGQASVTRTQEGQPTTISFVTGTPPELHTLTLPAPSPNLYDARVTLQYPLYTGGRIEAQIALAEANVRGAEATLERIKQQIIFGVRQAYFQLQLAQAGLDVAERSVAQATENLRVARARVAAGASPKFDEVQADVALANALQSRVRARNGIAQAMQALAGVLNLPLNTPLRLTDALTVRPVRDPVDALVVKAVQARPEFAELAARQAAAQAGIQLAESGAKPNVALQATGSYSNSGGLLAGTTGSTNWSVTLAATLNLYDGGITRERVREARLRLEQLRAVEAQQKQGVELEVRQAYLNLQSAAEELAGADALITQAQEALRIANVRFQSGVGTNLEVLNAQTAASQAEAGKVQALFNYNLARATLERAVGADLP